MSTPRSDTRDGVILGIVAYASVAAFYSLFDMLAARGTFYTVNLLGLSVFRGLRDPSVLTAPVPLDMTAIAQYNAVHLALSLLIGIVVMRLVGIADREPARRPLMLLLIVGGWAATIVVVGLISASIRVVLPWWTIVVANSAAVAFGAMYVARGRPGIVGRVLTLSGQRA